MKVSFLTEATQSGFTLCDYKKTDFYDENILPNDALRTVNEEGEPH